MNHRLPIKWSVDTGIRSPFPVIRASCAAPDGAEVMVTCQIRDSSPPLVIHMMTREIAQVMDAWEKQPRSLIPWPWTFHI